MWCLWRERNGCSFEDHERTLMELKDLFSKTLSLGCCLILKFFKFLWFFRSLLRYLLSFSLVYFFCTWIVLLLFLMNLQLLVYIYKKKFSQAIKYFNGDLGSSLIAIALAENWSFEWVWKLPCMTSEALRITWSRLNWQYFVSLRTVWIMENVRWRKGKWLKC